MVTSEYFLDEMKMYELSLIMDGLDYCDRNDLERTRMLLSPYIKGNIKNKIKFPWDKETIEYEGSKSKLEDMKKYLNKKIKNEQC